MPHSQDGLHLLLVRHRHFLEQVIVFVAKGMSEQKTASYRELLLLLTKQLTIHKTWLANIGKCYCGENAHRQARPPDLTLPVWGLIVVTHRSCVAEDGGNRIVLQIDGPADGDTHIAAMETEQIATAATKALARATDQTALACGLPTGSTAQPLYPTHSAVSHAAVADTAYIALLKKYNDLRDIALQLIGLIADNRGVPARSLYTDGSFGVGVDD